MEIIRTDVFDRWLDRLRDRLVRSRIEVRLRRMEEGNLGDVKPIGQGLSEVRLDIAGGIRIYFLQREGTIIVLLVGGDKSSQARDIVRARHMAEKWRE